MKIVALAVLSLILIAGCGGSGAGAGAVHKKGPLNIGLFPALRPLVLVRQQKWLEQEGYEVNWTDFVQGISSEAAAMAAGSIDFAEADTSGIESVAAKNPGLFWYIASGTMNYASLVARPDSGIKSVADLKGKKVGGVVPNTGLAAVLQMMLFQQGLSLKDLQTFNILPEHQPAAMEKGAVDAVITVVPFSTEMVTSKTGVIIQTAEGAYGKTWMAGGIVVRPAFATAHPDDVVAVLRAVKRADDLLRNHPDKAYSALAKGMRTSPENVRYSYEHKLVSPAPVRPDRIQMLAQAQVMKQYGVLNVPDVDKFIQELVHTEFFDKT